MTLCNYKATKTKFLDEYISVIRYLENKGVEITNTFIDNITKEYVIIYKGGGANS